VGEEGYPGAVLFREKGCLCCIGTSITNENSLGGVTRRRLLRGSKEGLSRVGLGLKTSVCIKKFEFSSFIHSRDMKGVAISKNRPRDPAQDTI